MRGKNKTSHRSFINSQEMCRKMNHRVFKNSQDMEMNRINKCFINHRIKAIIIKIFIIILLNYKMIIIQIIISIMNNNLNPNNIFSKVLKNNSIFRVLINSREINLNFNLINGINNHIIIMQIRIMN